MLITISSICVLATLTLAAPQHSSRQARSLEFRTPDLAAARGLIWTPRNIESRKNRKNQNNNDVITITQLQETQLTIIEKGKEIQLTEIVEKKLVIIDQTKKNKDNIRKNHYKNKNNNVNTIIIVVTQIVDIRDSNNKNTRYMTHQVQSNQQIAEQQIIVVSDAQTMTVGAAAGTAVQQVASPTSTGDVAANVATYDPNAAPTISNVTQILPAAVAAPTFNGTQTDQDPAAILLENQAMFVQFVQSS